MNFKNQASKLERFLEEEFKKKTPLLVLEDKTLVYKKYKIKQNRSGNYNLLHSNNDLIDTFKLKATAAIAAKHYYHNKFSSYNEIKNLDTEYWTNSMDSFVFKERYRNCKDSSKKEIYLARWDITSKRAELYKAQIASIFKNSF